jgi:poly(A) polymerase
VADELGRRFASAGHELHLVGGPVRDALLGRVVSDLDFTTDARPAAILATLAGWADAVWDTGIDYGTVGASKAGLTLEITTYRSDLYDGATRNPVVTFGDTLADDLVRRDFAVNAMAVSLPEHRFTDLYGGLAQLADRVIDTPGTPEQSFRDDPLRMLRAARFASELRFTPAARVVDAMTAMSGELARITVERITAELTRLVCGSDPRAGLTLLTDTGLAAQVLPELPALRLETRRAPRGTRTSTSTRLTALDQAIAQERARRAPTGPGAAARRLLHDIGKPATRRSSRRRRELPPPRGGRRRMAEALRDSFDPNESVDAVGSSVSCTCAPRLRDGAWTDAAVRRYVRRRRAAAARGCTSWSRADVHDAQSAARPLRRGSAPTTTWSERIAANWPRRRSWTAVRPDLDGEQIIAHARSCGPGRSVGRAWAYLKELRLEHGPLGPQAAEVALLAWAVREGVLDPVTGRPPA